MKVRIKGNPITPFGHLSNGQIIGNDKYPEQFLRHLVEDANAADWLEYETKIDDTYEVKKKTQSSQSLEPVRASQKKTVKGQKKKHR